MNIISLGYFFKRQNLGVCETNEFSQVDALKMSVENLTQDVKELQERQQRGGVENGGVAFGDV